MKKVRILHVVKVLNRGGAETMIMNIFRNIDKSKVQFDFLCLSKKDGDYEKEILELGGNIYKLPDPKEQGRFKEFHDIYKLMKENKYNVVHSHIMFYNGFINLIAFLVGIKIRISHSHSSSDMKKETFSRKIYIRISRFLINMFSNVKISCGEKAGKYLYGNKQKFIILNNGIDLEKYTSVTIEQVEKLKEELGIKKDEFIIGHVGSFLEVKNQEFFIGIARELINMEKKFKIVLVGYGEKFDYIKDLIKKEKLEEYFVMPGIRNDIPVFMNMFDIFIMPSLYEGFPLSVVESLAGDNICYLSTNISKETNIIEGRVYFFDLNIDKRKLINNIYDEFKSKKNINIEQELTDKGFSIDGMVKQISSVYGI